MFGKIVKSVFLNKEARDAMEKRDAALRRKAAAESGESDLGDSKLRGSGPTTETLAEAAALARREAALDRGLRDKANATDLDRETIREAIASAHREVMESGDMPIGTAPVTQSDRNAGSAAPTEDHDELVRSAMLIYRQKQKVLDDLDPASKKKLRMMAKTVFGSQIKK